MRKNNSIVLGTRGSSLARIQTQMVEVCLRERFPDAEIRECIISSRGDIVRDRPISEVGEKGVFTKELEASLLSAETDIAVHSLKDMPATTGAGLSLAGVLPREDPRDALVSRNGRCFRELPEGATIGTSSLRRAAVIRNQRPDCSVREIRGNVDTRLRKLDEGQYDAVILAAAGLIRSNYQDRITEYLDPDIFVPAGCQGIIGMEVRENDSVNILRVRCVNHEETFLAAEGERSFMRTLEGGCSTPMGCLARISGGMMAMTGMVADLNGARLIIKNAEGPAEDATALGWSLAKEVIDSGGREILHDIGKY